MISVWNFNTLQKLELISDKCLEILSSSLDEITSALPKGAYTTFRTFNYFQVFRLDDHIYRLRHTCALENRQLQFSDEGIRAVIRDVIRRLPQHDYRVRILIPTRISTNEGYILTESLVPYPPKYYLQGIRVVTASMTRKKPKAKISTIIQETASLKDTLLKQSQEIILVDKNGELLEGVSSNFYAMRNDILYTARSGVLEGITRKAILEVVVSNNIPLRLKPVNISNLSSIQEAFISSSSRGIFPVIQINGTVIANGLPGKTTKKICELYKRKLVSELLPI